MSDCCSFAPPDAAGSAQTITTSSTPATGSCPACRDTGRIVEHRTMFQMLKPKLFSQLGNGEFYFCQEPTCPIVYYSRGGDVEFSTDDLRVEVGVKMQGDPSAKVCYCFGYTEGMIAEELLSTGKTTIPKKITQLTKTGMCACEVRNPAGVCCLGNVNKVVKRLSEEYKMPEVRQASATTHDCCSR